MNVQGLFSKSIIGVGIDTESCSRFTALAENPKFLSRIFLPSELESIAGTAVYYQRLAGKFCAKEAVLKAMSSSNELLTFDSIEIHNDTDGVPFVRFASAEIESRFRVLVSISHSKDNAIAVAIAAVRSHSGDDIARSYI